MVFKSVNRDDTQEERLVFEINDFYGDGLCCQVYRLFILQRSALGSGTTVVSISPVFSLILHENRD